MGFISSIFLWLLPLVSIPLIIHLLNKRNIKVIDFSTIRFLKLLETEAIRKLQLLQMLLMIIRTLIIFSIIFMMTRPIIKGYFSNWSDESTSRLNILLIDDTFSVHGLYNGEDRKLIIQDAYDIIITNIPENNQIIVSTINEGILYSGIRSKLPDLMKVIEFNQLPGKFIDLFPEIINSINEEYANIESFFITDAQKISFDEFSLFNDTISNWNKYIYILPQLDKNLMITNLSIDQSIVIPDSPFTLDFNIKNQSTNKTLQSIVQLFINDINTGQQLIELSPSEQSTFSFTSAIPDTGIYVCKIELQNDDRILDNQYNFIIQSPQPQEIASVLDQSIENIFIMEGINAINKKTELITQNNYFNNDVIINELMLNDVVLVNGYSIFANNREIFEEYLLFGGHIILFPNDDDHDNFDISTVIPNIKLENIVELENNQFQTISTEYLKENIIKQLFLSEDENGNREIKIFKFIPLPVISESELIMNNDNSFWIEKEYENGIIDIFSTAFTLEWTNFPIKGAFLPFLYHILFAHQNMDVEIMNMKTGDLLDLRQVVSYNDDIIHITPDQNQFNINSTIQQNNLLKFKTTGFHQIYQNNELKYTIPVNIPLDELQSPNITEDEIDKLTYSKNVYIYELDNINSQINTARIGSELWRFILYLLTFMVILEMIISNAKKQSDY